jgi:hypothetical protein
MHLQSVRLKVGVEGEVAVTDVYDHEISELLQQVVALGKVRRRLFGSVVLEVYDRPVGDRENLGPHIRIARQLVAGTGIEFVFRIQLGEVDREALEHVELPVDRQRGSPVNRRWRTTADGVDPAWPFERRPDYYCRSIGHLGAPAHDC